jgi:hypothetical protein
MYSAVITMNMQARVAAQRAVKKIVRFSVFQMDTGENQAAAPRANQTERLF